MAIPATNAIQPGALTAGAGAVSSLAGLALVIPQSSNPAATKGYQPLSTLNESGFVDPGAIEDPSDPLPPNLLFHYEDENSISLESDITDHYVESNSSVVDQISLKPEMVTVTGFIGELNNVVPVPLQILQTVTSTLTFIDGYTPQLSATALEAYNAAVLTYQTANSLANSAVSAVSSLSTLTGGQESTELGESGVFASPGMQDLQQAMFQQFYGYWNNRVLFNVQTPWAIFTNMAIKSLRTIQSGETRMITSFEVTFKKIRTANTFEDTAATPLTTGRATTQSADTTNLGTSSGTPADDTLGDNITASQ